MRRTCRAVALLLLLSSAPAAFGQARTDRDWTGLNGGTWTAPNNYNPSLIAGNGIGVMRFGASATGTVTTALGGSFTISALFIQTLPVSAGSVSIAPGVAGSTLTLDGAAAESFPTGLTQTLDLSTANRDLTVTAGLRAAAVSQSWVVAAGRTLNLSGGAGTSSALTVTLNNSANGGQVFLGGTGAFASGSTLALQNGVLRLDTTTALSGLAASTGGVSVSPQATAQLGLNATGTYTYTTPLALSSSSGTVRSQVNLLQPATATWGGAVSVTGTGTTGVVELNTISGGSLRFSSTVSGTGYGGALQLGGAAGTGALSGAVTLASTNSRLVKVGGSTWTLGAANAATAWSATQVQAGTLVTTVGAALPSGASLALGTPGSATVGTLDLYNTAQTVSGLTTATDDTLVDPAGNRIGLGDGVGPGAAGTLSYAGTSTAFAGTLVDNVGSVAGKTLGLTVTGGSLTLQSANSYSGVTLVTGGTLTLSSRFIGFTGQTNFGSFASSPSVTVRSGGTLNVTGATGGANSAGGQFALVANQTLQGTGGVTGAVSVPAAATVRGGEPTVSPAGQLSVAGSVTLRGGAAGSGGGQLVVDLGNTVAGPASKLAVTGAGNVVNVQTGGGPLVVALRNDSSLPYYIPVSVVVGTAQGGYQLNGASVGSYALGSDFTLTTLRTDPEPVNGLYFTNVSLVVSGTNPSTLTLNFTPVPEPATVLAAAAVSLGAVRLRRRILAG